MKQNNRRKAHMAIIIGVAAVCLGIAGTWAGTLAVTQTTVAVQSAEEDVIPENYEFTDGITVNNGVDDYYVSLCNASLQVLPDWLLEAFEASGWTIMVTSEDINAVYLDGRYTEGEGNVNGAAVYSMERIVIADSIQAASSAAVHEMGHWCDYVTADGGASFSSDSEEFISAYEKEADVFIFEFGIDNPDTGSRQELCADLFRYCWEEPAKLRKKCPEMYAWMEDLVAEAGEMSFSQD